MLEKVRNNNDLGWE